jgi:hypothetical protein
MKRLLFALIVGLALSFSAHADGYRQPYGYQPGYGNGYGAPAQGNYGYARAYPNQGFQGRRDSDAYGGRGWGGNGWGERREHEWREHEWREHHNGWGGRGWGWR